jgi:hypothetical protein
MVNVSEQRLKHLEFRQSAITRMAGKMAKGWSVAMTTAVVGLAAAEHAKPRLVILALLAPVAFWAIDGYCMHLERCYRSRFSEVNGTTEAAWEPFNTEPLTGGCSYLRDGLARPAVFGVHALVVLLALGAWWMLQ